MPDFPIVDTHLHVWDPARLTYSAFKGHPLFSKPFHVEDYARDCGDVAVEAMVFLECYTGFEDDGREYLEEVRFVEDEAKRDPRLRAIVPMAPLEDGDGARRSMRNALMDARCNPQDLQYVNAHATSTMLGSMAMSLAPK